MTISLAFLTPDLVKAALAGLVESGIMAKRKYREKGQRTRIEYPLTKMGTSLGLPFFAMTEWSDKWIGHGGSPFTLRSTANGQRIRVALVDECGQRVKPSEIEIVIDPKFRRS